METLTRHHTIITGTGRNGTTFIVQLLTELGFDTGFSNTQAQIFPNANAGMELDIRYPDAPYFIKNPAMCDYLDEVLAGGNIYIDYAIVPVRDLYSAAESRRDVKRRSDPSLYTGIVPGGLWHTEEPVYQEMILSEELYKLVYTLAKYDIPSILVFFPRLVNDPEYLYRKIRPTLGILGYDVFFKAFQKISHPEMVHDFKGQKNQKVQESTKEVSFLKLLKQVEDKEHSVQALEASVVEKERSILTLTAQVADKEISVQALLAQVVDKEKSIQTLTAQLLEIESVRVTQVAEKDQSVQALSVQVTEKEESLQALSAQMVEIKSSRAWRLIQILWRIRLTLFPHGSIRERLTGLIKKNL